MRHHIAWRNSEKFDVKTTMYLLAGCLGLVLPQTAIADWRGAYAGAAVGGVNGDAALGAVVGAQGQTGWFVYGVELGLTLVLDADDTGAGGAQIDGTSDLKIRLGVGGEHTLFYFGQVGSYVETSGGELDDDLAGGAVIGFDYRMSEDVSVGAEIGTSLQLFEPFFEEEFGAIETVSISVTRRF